MDTVTTPTLPATPGRVVLTDRDRELLRALLRHRSQAAVAAEVGYSDRHVRRLLNDLCRRLDAPTTHAAVAVAAAAGALNETGRSQRPVGVTAPGRGRGTPPSGRE